MTGCTGQCRGNCVINPRAAEMAEYLDGRLGMRNYDEAGTARALLLVAELYGLDKVADACGVSAETLRRQLNGMRPLYFGTVLGVMRALGIQLRVEPLHCPASPGTSCRA